MSKHGMQMGTSGFGTSHGCGPKMGHGCHYYGLTHEHSGGVPKHEYKGHGMKPNEDPHHESNETPAQEREEMRTGREAQHLMGHGCYDYGLTHEKR